MAAASDSPGYPTTHGPLALRSAVVGWLSRRHGVTGLDPAAVLPTIGSKEFIAWLPQLLGLGSADLVVHPALAYPTYDVGARLAGADVVASDTPEDLDRVPALLWVNSPANPTGRVLSPSRLRELVGWARAHGVVLASDECYLGLGWDVEPLSVLHPDVCGGSHEGLLAVHSLSKRSNLAGYRAAFVAGDAVLVDRLLQVRRHAGMMVPTPVQAAMTAALDDDAHADVQRARYATRRSALLPALRMAGFRVAHSEAGLYVWVTRDEDCRLTMSGLAARGILAGPGWFYGDPTHVRLALTAPDERIAAAVARLTAIGP